MAFSWSAVGVNCSWNGVPRISPGAIALAVMPRAATSLARALVSPVIPALAAA